MVKVVVSFRTAKKLDLDLVSFGQRWTVFLYQPLKLISTSGISCILSFLYVIVPSGLKYSNYFPFGLSSIFVNLKLLSKEKQLPILIQNNSFSRQVCWLIKHPISQQQILHALLFQNIPHRIQIIYQTVFIHPELILIYKIRNSISNN